MATTTPAQQILTSIVMKSATVNSTDDNSSGKEFSLGTVAATQAPSTLPEILAKAGSGTSAETLTSTSETLPDMSSTGGHAPPLERKITTDSLNVQFKTTEDAQKSPTSESTPSQVLETFEQPDAITAVTEYIIRTDSRKAPNEELSTKIQTITSTAELVTGSISGTAISTLQTTMFMPESNIEETPGSFFVPSSKMQSSASSTETLTRVDTGPVTNIPKTNEQVLLTGTFTTTEYVALEDTSLVMSTASAEFSTTAEPVLSP